jgi:hypothetical protein
LHGDFGLIDAKIEYMTSPCFRFVYEISRPLLTADEAMRMKGPLKDPTDMILEPGEMVIYVAGYPAIRGTQPLYFKDCELVGMGGFPVRLTSSAIGGGTACPLRANCERTKSFMYRRLTASNWRSYKAKRATVFSSKGIRFIPMCARATFSWRCRSQGIRDYRATGSVLALPYYLAQMAEALHLAGRTSEALEAISEAEALAERFEQRVSLAELHRLRGVFLTTTGADETQIEGSFQEATKIAKEQKSVSLAKRAEATYAEYRRQKGERVRYPRPVSPVADPEISLRNLLCGRI